MEAVSTRIYPEWKNAVAKAAESFQHGDLISFDWLHEHFGIQKPVTGLFNDFQEYQFEFLSAIDGFKNELLESHKMALANVRGEGYRVVMPKDQTEFAEKKFIIDIHKSVKRAASILNNIKFDALDDNERKQNADAKSRIAAIYSMTPKKKLIAG